MAQGENNTGIYSIINIRNGKRYVGSAVNLRRRLKDHWTHLKSKKSHCQKLQRAWDKYGPDAFIFEVIEYVENKHDLISREQHWIDYYHAYGEDGYNLCPVAGSCLGRKLTPKQRAMVSLRQYNQSAETRAKIAATLTGRKRSPETIEKLRAYRPTPEGLQKMSIAGKGRKQSPETIAKRVAALTGQKRTVEQRAKMSKARKERKYIKRIVSDETRAKLSAARLGKKLSPETIAKLTGKKRTPEVCARISAYSKGRKMSKEAVEKSAAAHRGQKRSIEVRAAISERMTLLWENRRAVKQDLRQ